MRKLLELVIDSGRNYGWMLAVIVAIAAFGLAAQGLNPVKEGVDGVSEAVDGGRGNCPSGWEDTSDDTVDAPVLSCERTVDGVAWQVVLDQDGDFEHATPLDTPGATFIFDPEEVPTWPAP